MAKELIEIKTDATAVFRERPNKYIAIVDVIEPFEEKGVVAHVHDPGRLTEILYPGNLLRIKHADNPNRKTAWDVIVGKVDENWVLIHSGYHRKIAISLFENQCLKELGNPSVIKPEVPFEESRLDFLLEYKRKPRLWIETKGCTLVEDGIARFPDAPTKRGTKHLNTLQKLHVQGEKTLVLFMIMNPDAKVFTPNSATDPDFSQKLFEISNLGTTILPVVFAFKEDRIHFIKKISLQS